MILTRRWFPSRLDLSSRKREERGKYCCAACPVLPRCSLISIIQLRSLLESRRYCSVVYGCISIDQTLNLGDHGTDPALSFILEALAGPVSKICPPASNKGILGFWSALACNEPDRNYKDATPGSRRGKRGLVIEGRGVGFVAFVRAE